MNHILCPVDFSEPSRHGLTLAQAVARWFGARLTLMYVHQLIPSIVGIGPAIAASPPAALSDAERRSLEASLRTFGGVDDAAVGLIDSRVVEDTSVAGGILDHAAEIHADLIVIGTRGRSRLERLGLGSVAEVVLRKAECPVLAVPPHVSGRVRADPGSIRHVLCPLDLSPHSINALPQALLWASKSGARITALHVAEISPELATPPIPEFEAYRDRVVGEARRHLADAVREVTSPVPIEQRLAVGRPAAEILRYAAGHEVELIVMGIRGRSQVDIAFFGSTANRVVRQAACPILIAHGR
jgi:nucleotide-binding universal stress UspA family protein